VEAHIPYRVPEASELADRLDEVLAVLYLMFNEGYLATSGRAAHRRDLADDADWLASLLVRLMPNQPEALGLLALIRLHRARLEARFDAAGRLVLLRDQDRSLWDRAAITAASALILKAGAMHQPGPYQLQAAIAACHAEAASWEQTDWEQIFLLYQGLQRIAPSPVVQLNRAIALGHLAGPEPALGELDALAEALDRYHLFHASRAKFLRELGRHEEARQADVRALALTENPAERALLQERLAEAL
jgi:RNA polymerase sigma-70 factor (ECF subfamily)